MLFGVRDLFTAEKSLTPSTQILVSKYHSHVKKTGFLGEMADSRTGAAKEKPGDTV